MRGTPDNPHRWQWFAGCAILVGFILLASLADFNA